MLDTYEKVGAGMGMARYVVDAVLFSEGRSARRGGSGGMHILKDLDRSS